MLPALLVGAYLPDMVDKPLSLFLNLPFHGIGHSFLVLLLLFTPLILFLKNYRGIVVALGLGCLLHLLGDLEETDSIFWPFAGDIGLAGERFSLSKALHEYYVQQDVPSALLIEVLSILGCIFLITYERIKAGALSSTKVRK